MLAEHQDDAVARALDLLARRGAVLLADDVGLGKSFVAAEVMRRSGLACDLIVPAALVEQWRATLNDFGVTATITTHDAIITEPFMPRPLDRLVVVDEAHAFRNPRTRRYAALASRTIAARLLLITATPVCNSARDLEALLRLLARDDLLRGEGIPSIDAAFLAGDRETIASIVGLLVIRRGRSVLPPDLQFGALDRRVLRHPVPDTSVIDQLTFPLVGEAPLLRRFLRRRLESSEAALLESIRRQVRFYERALAAIAAGRTLRKRDYREGFAHEEDADAFQEVLFWDLFAPPASVGNAEDVRAEIRTLDALAAATRAAPSIKRDLLIELLQNVPEPSLIFTGSAATAEWLASELQSVARCGLVTSRTRSREAVIAAFCGGRLDLVVSTDMAAEGLNLQRAGMVVHYDLPWNPVKLDQRNGRAHRIGQHRAVVKAVYFIPESRETRIVETIARKNRIRRSVVDVSSVTLASPSPTMRPRLGRGASFHRLQARVQGELPERLALRHRAGLELLIEEMSGEYLDEVRLKYLIELAEADGKLAGS